MPNDSASHTGSPSQDSPAPAGSGTRRRRLLAVLLAACIAGAGGWWATQRATPTADGGAGAPGQKAGPGRRVVPAVIENVRAGDVPVMIRAVGTVAARTTTVVRSRVDGLLERITFREGDTVKEGDTLALIDARPFAVQVQAAQGQLARDRAQLEIARVDLARYRKLADLEGVSRQQVDAQEALVKQLEGVVDADTAALATARLNLSWTKVTAPLSGRIGLRQVDPGNLIRGTDPNGIVVITEVQPITVVFSIPQERLPEVLAKVGTRNSKSASKKPAADGLIVQALDRDGQTVLDTGRLLAIDNQIDPATGTVKLKAIFRNENGKLFPNQFVNVRMIVDKLQGALTVPTSAIQRGAQGTFVFAVTDQKTAAVRKVQLGPPAPGERIVVLNGVTDGEPVVIDGADKLRDGAPVVAIEVPVRGGGTRGGPGAGSGPGATGAAPAGTAAPNPAASR